MFKKILNVIIYILQMAISLFLLVAVSAGLATAIMVVGSTKYNILILPGLLVLFGFIIWVFMKYE